MLISAVLMHAITGFSLVAVASLCGFDVLRFRRQIDQDLLLFTAVLGLTLLTGGVHHLHHAQRLVENMEVGAGDFGTILLSMPAAAVWMYLRFERQVKRQPGWGDRLIVDHWHRVRLGASLIIAASGFAAGFSLARALEVARFSRVPFWDLSDWWEYVPQLVIAVAFVVVGIRLWLQANTDYRKKGYWSLSGLALAGLFLTSAMAHLVHGTNIMRGYYGGETTTSLGWTAAVIAVVWAWLVIRAGRAAASDT